MASESAAIELPGITVRKFVRGEETRFIDILDEAYGHLLDSQRVRDVLASDRFSPEGSFIAEEGNARVGCVAVTSLPKARWFVLRYLAATHGSRRLEITKLLLDKAIRYMKARNAESYRATGPAIQPYVGVYKDFGFEPIRVDLRVRWDLDLLEEEPSSLSLAEVTVDNVDEAGEVFVEANSPYWDWRTEEEGGATKLAGWFKKGVKQGQRWMFASVGGKTIGLAGLVPNYYSGGEAWFRGAFILPEFRGKGFGLTLMNDIMRVARQMGQRRMTVQTFSHLDSLAPGALLYLRSGGTIDAEYLQMQGRRQFEQSC